MCKLSTIKRTASGRRILSGVLVVLMLLGLLPVTVFAAVNLYTMTGVADAAQLGTFTYEGENYPVYRVVLDTDQYNAIQIYKAGTTEVPVLGASTSGKTFITEIEKPSEAYSAGVSYYQSVSASFPANIQAALDDSAEKLGFFWSQNKQGATKQIFGFLIIEWPEAEATDKTALNNTIAQATALSSEDYYTSGDRYNGVKTSDNGFWTDFQAALTTAQSIQSNTAAKQEEINDAAAALSSAIANLIPINQINATELYEEYTHASDLVWFGSPNSAVPRENHYDVSAVTQATTSVVTWSPYAAAMDIARGLLGRLFDSSGAPAGENNAGEPGFYTLRDSVKDAVYSLEDTVYNLDHRADEYGVYDAQIALDGMELYRALYNSGKLDGGDYTAESWSAFQSAYSSAGSLLGGGAKAFDGMGTRVVTSYLKAFTALRAACYGLTEKAGSITVELSVVDNYSVRQGRAPVAVYTGPLTLPPGAALGDALSLAGVTLAKPDPNQQSLLGVYVNGVFYLSDSNISAGRPTNDYYTSLPLSDGDTVVAAMMDPPRYAMADASQSDFSRTGQIGDAIRYQSIAQEREMVEAGSPFSLTVTADGALPSTYTGTGAPLSGATVYVSAACGTREEAEKITPAISTEAVTDENGKASVTLYREGWYALNAFDLGDNGGLSNGQTVFVQVSAAPAPASVKADLQAKLDAVYEYYPEEFFHPEKWSQLQSAYTSGTEKIAAASDTGDAWDSQREAISAIREIQDWTLSDNESQLSDFRDYLNRLPDDVNKLDSSVQALVDSLLSTYASMSSYQASQITGLEQEKVDSISARAGEGELPEGEPYTLDLNVEVDEKSAGDADTLKGMLKWLTENTASDDHISGDTGNEPLYPFDTFLLRANKKTVLTKAAPDTRIWLFTSPEYASYLPVRRAGGTLREVGWSISDEKIALLSYDDLNTEIQGNMTYTVHGTAYELKSVRFSGIDESDITWGNEQFLDKTTYKGKSADAVNMDVPESRAEFRMPYNDLTVTAVWGPVSGTAAEIEAAKEAAEAAVHAVYSGYDLSKYDSTGLAALLKAREDGLSVISAATSLDGVKTARQAALAAMASVAKKISGPGQVPDEFEEFGDVIGQVYIRVENNTFPGGDFTGDLLSGWYDLREEDTIMTAMLRALKTEGYSWKGTGGSEYTITYLATIYEDQNENGKWDEGEPKLGEFDGEPGSGWMVTMNDWFINESMQSFSVQSASRNFLLENGDEIDILYTQNLGADLGGTWGSDDTGLSSLGVSGGTLTPDFTKANQEYSLIISGNRSNIQITPTAANKNYLVKTFLNTYNSEAAFYKRTETISVKSGDILYVGCGDRSWPSMNKQETEAIEYTGTTYTIKVFGDNGEGIKARIAALPAAEKMKYSNYKQYSDTVADIRTALDALSNAEKTKVDNQAVLLALEKRIAGFAEIDAVKALLSAIPSVNKLTTADKSKVEAAYNAYIELEEEQQKYITVSDTEKYNAAVEWLKAQGISTPGSISGSEKAPEEGAEVVLSPSAVVSDGTAKTSVSASDLTNAISEAAKNDSTAIVIAPQFSGVAKKVTVEFQKSSISAIGSETDAALTIKTTVGHITIPNAALAGVASLASGSSVTMSFEAVESSALSAAQQTAVGDKQVFDLSILSGDKKISTFGGKSINIALPYTLKEGESADGVTIWYLNDKNELEPFNCTYDKSTGLATFSTDHLSYYVVGCVEAWKNPFTDVKDTDWFYEAVKYAAENELFSGTSATAFSPNADMTRAMLVTALYRLEGKPITPAVSSYTDVEEGQWYTDAVEWASASNLVGGYGNGLFGTNDFVTREQIASILYRYAVYKKYDVTVSADLTTYTDAPGISSWANEAVRWANEESLITGRTALTLVPGGRASRAEVATILMRFAGGSFKP